MLKLSIINMNMVLLEGIKSILNSETKIELVATGEQKELEQLVKIYQPNTVLLHIGKTNIYQLDMIRNLQEIHPNTHFLVMSDNFTLDSIKELIEVGVNGFIHQQISSEELIQAIFSVGKGHAHIPLYVSELILPDYKKSLKIYGTGSFIQLEVRKPFHLLTGKECTVLQLLAEGKSNISIAETMKISDKTVKNHVSSVLLKMEVRDRTQAVIKAIKKGWIHLN